MRQTRFENCVRSTYVCSSPKTQVHYVHEGVGIEVGEVGFRVWFCVVQLGTKPLLCVCHEPRS